MLWDSLASALEPKNPGTHWNENLHPPARPKPDSNCLKEKSKQGKKRDKKECKLWCITLKRDGKESGGASSKGTKSPFSSSSWYYTQITSIAFTTGKACFWLKTKRIPRDITHTEHTCSRKSSVCDHTSKEIFICWPGSKCTWQGNPGCTEVRKKVRMDLGSLGFTRTFEIPNASVHQGKPSASLCAIRLLQPVCRLPRPERWKTGQRLDAKNTWLC